MERGPDSRVTLLVRKCVLRAGGLLLIAMLSGACAFEAVRPGSPVSLGASEGLLVLHTQCPWPIQRVEANRISVARSLARGTNVRLVRLPAGEYRWSNIVFERYAPLSRLTPYRLERWRFSVEAGKVNYPGLLLLEPGRSYRSTQPLVVRSINRSAMMLPQLEAQFPTLLREYEIRYTGHVPDDFLAVHQQQRIELEREATPPSDLEPR